MSSLPEPDFIKRDPVAITQELVAMYEEMSGRTLQPAQVERLIIDMVAYREALVRTAIQEAALQNLVAFARYPMLDYLAELYGVARLPASAAITTLRFDLAQGQAADVLVPAGTRVKSKDGKVVFATDEDLTVAAADGHGEVSATATEAGAAGNGYLAGEVKTLVDPVAGIQSATNTAVSFGGADAESDEQLRQRVREAPEKLTVAGSAGAYRWHAISAHQDVVDAHVASPEPGRVVVTVLARDGLPGQTLLDLVEAALSHEKVRPLTDSVTVQAPARVGYTITAALTLYRDAIAATVLAAAQAAAESWAERRRARLGMDLVPSQIIAALSVDGVYDVTLSAPAAREVASDEWADCEGIDITVAGWSDG